METWQEAGFGIYVHWPFCAAKCPYCDFNSHVVRHVDHPRWCAALLAEIDHWAERTQERVVSSVFFGGGTPSLMEPGTVAAVLDRIRARWSVANDLEVTLEANPTSVEAGRFREFVGAGINRFSVGLQALDQVQLQALGRLHTVDEGRRAFEVARGICDRVSFDLIYARQNQTETQWQRELDHALSMAAGHLSLYQLTVEDGTPFADRAAVGRLSGLPDEDRAVAMFEITQEATASAGLPRYEVSNHASEDQTCRHNMIYWRGGDWLGIGPGAHGRVTTDRRYATANVRQPGAWLARVESAGAGTEIDDALQDTDIVDEYVLMALRLREGLSQRRLRELGGGLNAARLETLASDGLVEVDGDRVRATGRGTLLLNGVIGALLPFETV